MNTQTIPTPNKFNAQTVFFTAAAAVIASLGLMTTTIKPSLADTYVPGHYAEYGQWIPGHYNAGPVPHQMTAKGMYYEGHYGAGGLWIPGHYE